MRSREGRWKTCFVCFESTTTTTTTTMEGEREGKAQYNLLQRQNERNYLRILSRYFVAFLSPSLSAVSVRALVYIYDLYKGRSCNDFWNSESFLSCTTPNCLNSHGRAPPCLVRSHTPLYNIIIPSGHNRISNKNMFFLLLLQYDMFRVYIYIYIPGNEI